MYVCQGLNVGPSLPLSPGQMIAVPHHLSCINHAHIAPNMISNVGFIKGDRGLKDACQLILLEFYESFINFYSCRT